MDEVQQPGDKGGKVMGKVGAYEVATPFSNDSGGLAEKDVVVPPGIPPFNMSPPKSGRSIRQEANAIGNYNVLLAGCPAQLYDSEKITWEQSYEKFHDAFVTWAWFFGGGGWDPNVVKHKKPWWGVYKKDQMGGAQLPNGRNLWLMNGGDPTI